MKKKYAKYAAIKDMNPDLQSNRFLKSLNAESPQIPIINLYGNEDDCRLVRLAGTYEHKKENDSPQNISDACYDETLFSCYNSVLATCIVFEVWHYATGTAMALAGALDPCYLAASAVHYSAADKWTEAHRFVQYDVHNEWDRIIGATHVEKVENWHKFLWWSWCDVEYVTVSEANDGFIPNKCSIMDGSGLIINREIKGVNHLEMNSHKGMRQNLVQIFTGAYGKDFNPKQ